MVPSGLYARTEGGLVDKLPERKLRRVVDWLPTRRRHGVTDIMIKIRDVGARLNAFGGRAGDPPCLVLSTRQFPTSHISIMTSFIPTPAALDPRSPSEKSTYFYKHIDIMINVRDAAAQLNALAGGQAGHPMSLSLSTKHGRCVALWHPVSALTST